ncbi:unnamed protein product, partial [Discosporangium mesarthrocarpum]
SFWEPGVEPEVQRMRHEAYSQRRHEMMRLCRLERRRLINAEHKASRNGGAGKGGGGVLLEQQQQANTTMIEMEERRIEKMRQRQVNHQWVN